MVLCREHKYAYDLKYLHIISGSMYEIFNLLSK